CSYGESLRQQMKPQGGLTEVFPSNAESKTDLATTSLIALSLHQSTGCSFHKKAACCQRRFLVNTDAVHKPDRLQCANARACDGHDANQFVPQRRNIDWTNHDSLAGSRRSFGQKPPVNPLSDCRPAMNMVDSVSDS